MCLELTTIKNTFFFAKNEHTNLFRTKDTISFRIAPGKSMTVRQSGLYREIQATQKLSRGHRDVSTGTLGRDNRESMGRHCCSSGKREFVQNEWSYALRLGVWFLPENRVFFLEWSTRRVCSKLSTSRRVVTCGQWCSHIRRKPSRFFRKIMTILRILSKDLRSTQRIFVVFRSCIILPIKGRR